MSNRMFRLCILAMTMLYINLLVDTATAQETVDGGATIRGEVTDAPLEQNPIPEVSVKIVNSADGKEYTALTLADGTFELKGLPPGRYVVTVSKKGYGDRAARSQVLSEGGENYISMRMRKNENIATFLMDDLLTWQLFLGIAFGAIIILFIFALRGRI